MSMIPSEHVGEAAWLVCAQKDVRIGLRWEPRCVTIVRYGGGLWLLPACRDCLWLLPAWRRIGNPGTPMPDLFATGDATAALLRANELNLDELRGEQSRVASEVARLERERESLIEGRRVRWNASPANARNEDAQEIGREVVDLAKEWLKELSPANKETK